MSSSSAGAIRTSPRRYPRVRGQDVRERGRGIGQTGTTTACWSLAVKDREVRVEVGYELEQFITDGFAGETIRQTMAPYFRRGEYGPGLVAALSRIVGRIAEGRNVTLRACRSPAATPGTGRAAA